MLHVRKQISYTDGYTECVDSSKVPHDLQDVRDFQIKNVTGKFGKYYFDKSPSDGSELLESEILFDPGVELSDMIAARIAETDMLATKDIETIKKHYEILKKQKTNSIYL